MKIRTSMREALTDKNLLGKALPGPSWHTWRTMLLATMGEPFTDAELETFTSVTGRQAAPDRPCEEFVGIIGRRGGKSRAESVQATYLATLVDYRDVLSPGERGLVLCIAPDIRQAAIVHSYIAANIEQSPALKPLLESSTQTTLRLRTGIDIEVRSASFRRLRGVTAVAVIADELCFWFSDESSANRDTEILQAVRPTLLTTHGPLILISTPYSRRGATWEAFSRDYGPQGDPAILVATGSSQTFNPSLSQKVIDRAYERDPAAAAAEYGGQWRADISAFISREALMACVDHGVIERPYRAGIKYYGHTDPSGGSNDSMTMTISHAEDGCAMVDLIREVRAPFSPEFVVAEFCETLANYRIKRISGDRYGGEWPREQFRKHGVLYETAERTASQQFLELLPLINAKRVGLLDHKRMLDQLIGLERRTGFGTGKDAVGHPPGCHDDIAVAVAGAVLLTLASPVRIEATVGCQDGSVLYRDPGGGWTRRWPRKEREPLRIVRVSEAEALRQKAAGEW